MTSDLRREEAEEAVVLDGSPYVMGSDTAPKQTLPAMGAVTLSLP
jgi:hypothetical protein